MPILDPTIIDATTPLAPAVAVGVSAQSMTVVGADNVQIPTISTLATLSTEMIVDATTPLTPTIAVGVSLGLPILIAADDLQLPVVSILMTLPVETVLTGDDLQIPSSLIAVSEQSPTLVSADVLGMPAIGISTFATSPTLVSDAPHIAGILAVGMNRPIFEPIEPIPYH